MANLNRTHVFSQQVDIEKRGFIAFGVAWMRYREVLLVNKNGTPLYQIAVGVFCGAALREYGAASWAIKSFKAKEG